MLASWENIYRVGVGLVWVDTEGGSVAVPRKLVSCGLGRRNKKGFTPDGDWIKPISKGSGIMPDRWLVVM